MASALEPMRRSPFSNSSPSSMHRTIPILPSSTSASTSMSSSSTDPMDVTPTPSSSMAPPVLSSPNPASSADSQQSGQPSSGPSEPTTNGNTGVAVGAAAAAQQPKVVQTAFIHKLYNMLEDTSISHLIAWSNTNESFVMSPSSEFSKVLSSYFKHTNISSFVRQLNMYGFHKVSDVFHTSAPDSPLWEFKHGNGSFRRGDLVGLREIKRRASRHALIHRDSFSTGAKVATAPPGTPVEPMPDPVESRLNVLEHSLYDMHARLQRAEDNAAYMASKCQTLSDGLTRCHQWTHDLSNYILAVVPDPENHIHKDVTLLQREVARQIEAMRAYEDSQEPLHSARQPYFSGLTEQAPPLSPRQTAQTDSRRGSLANNSHSQPFRAPVPPHLAISPRRFGSIGGSSTYSPSSARAPPQPGPPPPPVMQHPLAAVASPPSNLPRRHTSADIRLHGWQGPQIQHPGHSPYASGSNSTQWPSSPHRAPIGGDEQLRNALAQYELPRGPRQQGSHSRQGTPPPPGSDPAHLSSESGWQLPGARYPFKGLDTPGPPTRRSSMASNVHSLLNPAETAERADEDDGAEDRKRKRVQ